MKYCMAISCILWCSMIHPVPQASKIDPAMVVHNPEDVGTFVCNKLSRDNDDAYKQVCTILSEGVFRNEQVKYQAVQTMYNVLHIQYPQYAQQLWDIVYKNR